MKHIRKGDKFTTISPNFAEAEVTGVFREYLNRDSEGPYILIEFEDINGETHVMTEHTFLSIYTLAPKPEVKYYRRIRDGVVERVTYCFDIYEQSSNYERVDVTPHND